MCENMLIMEFRSEVMSCSNLGNENSDEGLIEMHAGRRFPTSAVDEDCLAARNKLNSTILLCLAARFSLCFRYRNAGECFRYRNADEFNETKILTGVEQLYIVQESRINDENRKQLRKKCKQDAYSWKSDVQQDRC